VSNSEQIERVFDLQGNTFRKVLIKNSSKKLEGEEKEKKDGNIATEKEVFRLNYKKYKNK